MANKIKFGLSKAYYAPITYSGGSESYGTPVALPGAVNLSMAANSEDNPFYADNIIYFQSDSNNGYDGTLELALIPDSFRKDILGETEGTNNILTEYANVESKEFALLFQFEGDDKATAHALYRVKASRPDVASQTKEAGITPVTETLNLKAMPRISDHLVRGKCPQGGSAYSSWYSAVQLPTFSS